MFLSRHGHVCSLNAHVDNEWMRQRRSEDERTTAYLAKLGWRHVVMYECEWLVERAKEPVKSFLAKYMDLPNRRFSRLSLQHLLTLIEQGKMYGCGLGDFTVADHLKNTKFTELGPFVSKKTITFDMLAPHVQKFIEDNNRSKAPREMLVDCCDVTDHFFTSDILAMYLKHGIVVKGIKCFYEYKMTTCSQAFVDKVTKYRQEANLNEMTKQLGSFWKVNGNSVYGRFIIRKDLQSTTRFVGEKQVAKLVRRREFSDMDEVGDHFMVKLRKRCYVDNTPMALGSFILQKAKEVQFRFFYEFLSYYLDKRSFQACTTDTDSVGDTPPRVSCINALYFQFYIAISKPTLEEAVRADRKEEFDANRDKFIADPKKPESRLIPHLFKEECVFS